MIDGVPDADLLASLEQEVKAKLKQEIPEQHKNTIPEPPTRKQIRKKIDDINTAAAESFLGSYDLNEQARRSRQTPLLNTVVKLTIFQMVSFNLIMAAIVGLSFHNASAEVLRELFVILKYYIGATVVELIGMIWFVTKETFTSDHVKTIEQMIKGNKSNQTEQ